MFLIFTLDGHSSIVLGCQPTCSFCVLALEMGSSTQWRKVNKRPQTLGIEVRPTGLLHFFLHGLYQSRSGQISQPGVVPLDVEKDENLQHNSGISSPFAFKQEEIKEG